MHMFRRSLVAAAALSLSLALPGPATRAATSSATMAVTATVLSTCTIAALPMVFGNYSTATIDVTSQLTVICTTTTPFNVGLNAGTGSGATVSSRKMTNGVNVLNYSLFSDAARTVNWGNTVGTDTVTGTGTGLAQILTVYGHLPSGQFAGPGLYTDVVLATVTY